MALSFEQTVEAERWLGTVETDEEARLETRIVTLGDVVILGAYELLRTRLSEMLRSPDELRLEGDARARWVEAKKSAASQLSDCLNHIRWLVANGRISLNQAAKDMLGPELDQGRGNVITFGSYNTLNPRP